MPNFTGSLTHAASGKSVSFSGSWTIHPGGLAQWEASIAPTGEPTFIVRGDVATSGSDDDQMKDVTAAVRAHIQGLDLEP